MTVYSTEYRIEHKDGGTKWVYDNVRISYKENGEVDHFEGVIIDITDRKQAEQALRESEERYRQVVSTTTDAVMVFDVETREFVEINESCTTLYGYSRDEFLEMKQDDITAELAESDATIRKTAAGQLHRIPLRYHKKKDGTVFPVEISASTFILGGRRVVCGLIRDITERKQAAEAIKKSEHDKALILNNTSEIIAYHDLDHVIHWANEAYRDATGLSLDEMKGKVCYRAWGLERACDNCPVFAAIELGEACEAELTPQNQQHWPADQGAWLIRADPVKDEDGNIIGAIEVATDITDRRRAEAQREEVLEASRLKSEFLATMSHELRTPLNSILALSELMLSGGTGKDPERDSEFLTVMHRNGRQLLDLINDILSLSSIEAGQTRMVHGEFEPRAVVGEALEIIDPLAEAKGLSIETRIADVATMYSDRDRLRQILLNLLGNAVKFTESGQITVVVSESADTVSFEVTDTGIGIPPDILPDIFDQFRQADGSNTRVYGGTGLGLAIAQGLAALLGGQITVRSEVGAGSTFTLVLPARIAEAPGAVDQKSLPGESSETKGLSTADRAPRVILIVEDNADNLLATKAALERIGYVCRTATDGEQAVVEVRSNPPALILMDIQLPTMDGLEATSQIKADAALRDIPVVALTAKAMVGDREAILAAGCDDYLSKPIDIANLENMLAKWLA
ncbi:MAG: PAS domain S-box protein [Phycisphaerae bacterium]|jgi:PAS domain S-box-containing protein|nr:PAS domain S-box protein [Phycisphaerae bacterium]